MVKTMLVALVLCACSCAPDRSFESPDAGADTVLGMMTPDGRADAALRPDVADLQPETGSAPDIVDVLVPADAAPEASPPDAAPEASAPDAIPDVVAVADTAPDAPADAPAAPDVPECVTSAQCPTNESCDVGTCYCPAPNRMCGFLSPACLDLQTDPQNCGACDNTCLPGERCVGGACVQ